MKMNIQDLTREWVDGVLQHYADCQSEGLNQVFARGYFAGWSQREVKSLAEELRSNFEKYPPWPRGAKSESEK